MKGDKLYKQGQIAWGAKPEASHDLFIPIFSAQPLATLTLTILTHKLVTVRTHYLEQRTVPCIGKEHDCEGCLRQQSAKTKGYFGCWNESVSRLVLGELTAEAIVDCNTPLLEPQFPLRGLILKLWRTGKARNSRVRASVHHTKRTADEVAALPAAFDVEAALMRIWNGKRGNITAGPGTTEA